MPPTDPARESRIQRAHVLGLLSVVLMCTGVALIRQALSLTNDAVVGPFTYWYFGAISFVVGAVVGGFFNFDVYCFEDIRAVWLHMVAACFVPADLEIGDDLAEWCLWRFWITYTVLSVVVFMGLPFFVRKTVTKENVSFGPANFPAVSVTLRVATLALSFYHGRIAEHPLYHTHFVCTDIAFSLAGAIVYSLSDFSFYERSHSFKRAAVVTVVAAGVMSAVLKILESARLWRSMHIFFTGVATAIDGFLSWMFNVHEKEMENREKEMEKEREKNELRVVVVADVLDRLADVIESKAEVRAQELLAKEQRRHGNEPEEGAAHARVHIQRRGGKR